MRTLRPQHLKDSAWSGIEDQLKLIFYDLIFAPILSVINKETAQRIELKNSPNLSFLIEALRTGRVQYSGGVFTGDFNVRISNDIRSFGGQFDARSKTFTADVPKIPGAVIAQAAEYSTRAKSVHDELKRKMDDIEKGLDARLALHEVDASLALEKIQSDFRESALALRVQPKLSEDRARRLADDYNENLKLPIKDFSLHSIASLREAVEDNSLQGYRFDRLKDVIKQRYGVTANKAKFLARQETSLFMSKYRKERFGQAGVTSYRWSTAHDERVRDSHKRLDGRIFTYDDPPITDRSTGAKNNPGEDFNCRCVDIPLLDKVVEYV